MLQGVLCALPLNPFRLGIPSPPSQLLSFLTSKFYRAAFPKVCSDCFKKRERDLIIKNVWVILYLSLPSGETEFISTF